MIKLRNTTNQEIVLCEVLFREAGENNNTHEIPEIDRQKWANSDEVLQNISNGNVILSLNDNEITSINAAINTLKGDLPKEVSFTKVSPSTNRPEFTVMEPEGLFDSVVSHDFTDKTTWFQKSVRKTGVTLNENAGVYESGYAYWIDLSHGRHTKEDNISATYLPVVYDNGTELTEDSDFTVDYEAGTVTFTGHTPVGPVTADFSYCDVNGTSDCSSFKIAPPAGKILKIRLAEIDFTMDSIMQPVIFEIRGYDPTGTYPPPTTVPYDTVIYKNEKDVLKIGNEIQQITKWGAIQNDIKRVVFAYGRSIDLNSSAGMELHVKTKDDVAFTGEFSSITFYVVYEDEPS